MTTIVPLFSATDADRAYDAWGCNCGPSALAAVCGVTLDQARAAIPGFDEKRYTSPSMMYAALRQLANVSSFHVTMLGARRQQVGWPDFGLARIQWEGPWTEPGVPMAARYRETHWVGAQKHPSKDERAIFDVNAMSVGGVITLESWAATLVPHILQVNRRANGRWHITHSIEVRREGGAR